MLSANQSLQKKSVGELQLVQSNITNRRSIVSNMDKQLKILDNNIYSNTLKTRSLNKQLEGLKGEYTASVVNRYKDLLQNNILLFLFSSDSFFQMNLRAEYLERLASMAKKKSSDIADTQAQIAAANAKLGVEKKQQERIITSRKSEITELNADLKAQEAIVSTLKREESGINSQINQNNQLIAELQKMIADIIAAESKVHNQSNVTEEDKARNVKLSSNFESNKGKFPPPVDGVVVSRFGMQAHPTESNVKINNNGIDIQTTQKKVYSIFKGTVVKVFFFQGLNNSVMVRHGDYISVYSNLNDVRVKVGDEVSNRECIGTMVDASTKSLHFELWKGSTPQNPASWLDI